MPAQATYDPIATFTGDGTFNAPVFSNIPQTYTDLMLVVYARGTAAVSLLQGQLRYNDDTATNYSWTTLRGDGSSATSFRDTNTGGGMIINDFPGASATSGFFASAVIYINNYRSSVFKTTLWHCGNDMSGGGTVRYAAGLWRSTAAINDIRFITTTGNWATASQFTLYGITAA